MSTLLLLRHADSEAFRPGGRDIDRALTERGHRQARAVGEDLRRRELTPTRVLCSPSRRTRETLGELRIDGSGEGRAVEFVDDVYEAGSETLLRLITEVDAGAGEFDAASETVLLIGHAPGVPRLAFELAGADADSAALSTLDRGFPTAALAGFSLRLPWRRVGEPGTTRLEWLTWH